jgi:hypothetical protein
LDLAESTRARYGEDHFLVAIAVFVMSAIIGLVRGRSMTA